VILLRRLGGATFALNSDLIERVDSTPETVITLTDGTRYLVRESVEQVVERVRSYRGSVIAAAAHLEASESPSARPGRLASVPTHQDEDDEGEGGELSAPVSLSSRPTVPMGTPSP
jgi:flagellar protein FlbD